MGIILANAMATNSFPQSGQVFALRAGAAKGDVTPSEKDLTKNYEGILDHLSPGAIVIDAGRLSMPFEGREGGNAAPDDDTNRSQAGILSQIWPLYTHI